MNEKIKKNKQQMINYEPSKSSLFDSNKQYCEEIESKLKTINLDCYGFCNCYGYEIVTTLTKGNLTYHIKYHKHQSTQNGVVIPFDAIDYAGVEVTVTGIDKKFSITVGKSSFRRLFCSSETKAKIPAPYFIQSNKSTDDKFIYGLLESFRNNKISNIRLYNGELTCKIHVPTADPLTLISDIEKTLKKWV